MNRCRSDRGSVLPLVLAVLAGLLCISWALSLAMQAVALRIKLGVAANQSAVLAAGTALRGELACTGVQWPSWAKLVSCEELPEEVWITLTSDIGPPLPFAVTATARVGYGVNLAELSP